MAKAVRKAKTQPNLVARRTKGGGVAIQAQQPKGGWALQFKPETCEAIVESVRSGLPMTMAAWKNRVPQPTVSGWIQKGEDDPGGKYAEFAADIRQAQSEFVEEAISAIKDAGMTDARQWTALMTLLERIYPDQFKRPEARSTQNINIGIGFVEKKLHELHQSGEIVYDGG